MDLSKCGPDYEISASDIAEDHHVRSLLDQLTATSPEVPKWTPWVITEKASIGGLGQELERWVGEADVGGVNVGFVTTPFEDVVELLVPELRSRGIYPEQEEIEDLTAKNISA
ncbi:hypothetical protein EJ04DRAFT_567133 [Polyplosphaeria fusca]|uniref:Luciferase n=1 Tax=Polyplosphaeria fusca TaxID=682080 RepID=A0A9P4UZH9_9PLEO|nr:hypothetical protein EJ04DRAFT_567133 [Polyplosphaeria fusca]